MPQVNCVGSGHEAVPRCHSVTGGAVLCPILFGYVAAWPAVLTGCGYAQASQPELCMYDLLSLLLDRNYICHQYADLYRGLPEEAALKVCQKK